MRRLLALLLALNICFGAAIPSAFAEENLSQTAETVYEGEGFQVVFTLTGSWSGGCNANIKIENTSDQIIENWILGFDYEGTIANIWNGEISSQEDGYYVIKNAGWNQDIAAGGSVEFGFSGGEDFAGYPDSYRLLGGPVDSAQDDYSVSYHLDSDWGSGFTGTVSITNNSEQVIEDWVLEFDFGREIINIWNGRIESHEGEHYVIKNNGYNANIPAGTTISFGFTGEGGSKEIQPESFHLYSYGISVERRVSFDVLAEDVSNIPGLQKVENGGCVVRPESPTRDDYVFMGWYTDRGLTNYFDFEETTVCEDLTLYAKWFHYADETDTDGDSIADVFEELMGTDPGKADTDGDGISDYIEINDLGTDPLLSDTDGNGVEDGDEDCDGDGLSNAGELPYGTALLSEDTDGDGLSDGEEVKIYHTAPLLPDTDGDGVSDGKEIELGTDPLKKEEDFIIKKVSENEDSVQAAVELTLEGKQVETLEVSPVGSECLFPEDMPGYIGDAYEFSVEGTFDLATISFAFDKALLDQEGFDPVIYYFNEEEQELEPLSTRVSGNVAYADVEHFSKYILINRTVYENSFIWVDEWDTSGFTGLEVVFVIDSSISMITNDPDYERLTVARQLVDRLPEGSKIGVVKFWGSSIKLTSTLTENKDVAKHCLQPDNFQIEESTNMYLGILNAFSLFESTDDDVLKMIIVLSDGESFDTYLHSAVVSNANEKKIRIHTVGLGNSSEYFTSYMKPLAVDTAGKFYLAEQADELADIYQDINERIDLTVDSDGDGLPDYYEDHMAIFNGVEIKLDKNNPDTDGDGLPDGEEIVELKYIYNADKTKVRVIGRFESDPTSIDSDGDGLYDGFARWANGRIAAPADPDPLIPNGPMGMWNNHVIQQTNGTVGTEYKNDFGFQVPEFSELVKNAIDKDIPNNQEIADVIVGLIIKLRGPVDKYGDVFRPAAMLIKLFCNEEFQTVIGAYFLNFVYDNENMAYHSQPETWQRYFGYNDLYDDVFRIVTNMNNMPFKGGNYILWIWKGDYWNVHSGAEIGLYELTDIGDDNTVHYHAIDFEVPMTLSLYNYYGVNDIDTLFNWAPSQKQWWITGFTGYNTKYLYPNPGKMVFVGSVDLSETGEHNATAIYEALKATAEIEKKSNSKNKYSDYLIFDDENKTVWIYYYGRESYDGRPKN
ncbi:MAG: cellulose binding domain-containing protein [Roseburia sp.]|nr:cellulose binding domain-containing protein [Roseburia sp.]